MKAQPQTEAVRQRHLFLDRLRRADRGRAFVFNHLPRHQMAAVRGGIEHHIVRPTFDPAIKNGLQGFVMLVIMAERQVIAEQNKPVRRAAQHGQKAAHRGQILAAELNDLQRPALPDHFGMHRLDQTGFPHAARAPEQRVVRRQTGGELQRVGQQDVPHPVHPHQQGQRHARDLWHGHQPVRRGMPDKGIGLQEVRHGLRSGAQPLQRLGNADQGGICGGQAHAPPLSASSSSGSTHRPWARRSASRRFSMRRIRKIDTS